MKGSAMDEQKGTSNNNPAPENEASEVAQPVNPYGVPAKQPIEPPAEEPAENHAEQPAANPYGAASPVMPAAEQPANPYGAPEAQPAQPANPYAAPQPQQPASPYGAPQPMANPYDAANANAGQVPPFQPGQPVPPYGQPAGVPVSNGKATGALICGILAILLAWTILPGIILGVVAIVLAGSYIKQGGLAGTAKGGRVCGIVGIVLSVLSLVLSVVLGAAVFNAALNYGTTEFTYNLGSNDSIDSLDYNMGSSSSAYSSDSVYFDADEEQAGLALSAELDRIKNVDSAMVQQIAELADKGFTEEFGFPMADCGIDPTEYAKLMMRGFDYEVRMASVSKSSGEGFVSADVTCRDIFATLSNFNTEISKLADSGEVETMSAEDLAARIGTAFNDYVEEAPIDTNGYLSVDVVYKDGAWQVDTESWEEELDYFFGVV